MAFGQDQLMDLYGLDPEGDRIYADMVLGYDEEGRWEMGAVPLLVQLASLAPTLAARINRARAYAQWVQAEARRRGVHPSVVRAEMAALRQARQAAAHAMPVQPVQPSQPSPQQAPATPGRFRPFFSSKRQKQAVTGGVMPRALRPRGVRRRLRKLEKKVARRGGGGGGGGGGPRCVLVRGDDGEVYAVDENGNTAEIVGADEDIDMGDDDDDYDDIEDDDTDMGTEDLEGAYYGAEEEAGEDEDEDAMGAAEEAADELAAAVDADEQTFGSAESRLQRRIERLRDRISRIADKPIKGLFKKKKQAKRAKRIAKLRARINKLQGKQRRVTSKRRQIVTAMQGTAAGIGAAPMLGTALWSRQGQDGPTAMPPSRLRDPAYAHQVRMNQTGAGARAQYVAPPGSGRLNRVPMFAVGSENNPRNAISVPLTGISAGLDLLSEDLPYVLVKLVGFVASLFGSETENNAIGLVEDLKIRGGTNLFLHEAPADANNYNTSDDELSGLRSYPNIRSPNRATVTVKASGDPDDVIVITTALVVDILEDDTYGAGLAGPYAG